MRTAFVLPLLLLAGTAGGEPPPEHPELPRPAGLARLVRPAEGTAMPLVILLPDALGEDGRAEPYVDSLLVRGIATLALGLDDPRDEPSDPAATPEAVAPALAWAAENGFAVGSTGLLGFGLGGRAVLAAASGRPAVALYPGCAALRLPEEGPALVLQGGDAADVCATLPTRPGLEIRAIPGAGHGWDVPGAISPVPGAAAARSRRGRVAARPPGPGRHPGRG